MEAKIYDISPLVSERIAVWPNDTKFKRGVEMSFGKGHHLELSSLTTTVHLGAHADAPLHYHKEGIDIASLELVPYIGKCQLISLSERKPLIEPQDVLPRLEAGIKRVLVRTRSYPNSEHFNEDFTAFSAETVLQLGARGVLLIGIDTPSVDVFDSKDLPAHNALYKCDMRNLEGLSIPANVTDGVYELVALPLRLDGFDASPLRAILRTLGS